MWYCCGVVDNTEDAGVSTFISSLIPDELPLGRLAGGGVRILSSKVFQKPGPAEFLMAWLEKLLDGRRDLETSVLIVSSPEMSSRQSKRPPIAGVRFGDGAVVAG